MNEKKYIIPDDLWDLRTKSIAMNELRDTWILTLEAVKAHVRDLFTENEALKKENRELRAQRDYLQQMVDQTGGRG